MDSRHPPAEVQVDGDLARNLLGSQHPHLLQGELSLVDEGWDNYTYRVGRHHALRLPRREAAVQLLVNEQKWLPQLAPRLHLAVPVPVAVGSPSPLYPWPWTVVEWIEGQTAEGRSLGSREAESLAKALRSLHRPAPDDAPQNPLRGVPLSDRRAVVEERLGRLNLWEVGRPWRAAIEAPTAEEAVWLHGDLHPRNVLIREGRLAGIIDWGDLTAGDAATDLACAWMLFGPRSRSAFLRAYDPSPAERSRAIGWAVHFASAMLDSEEPRHVSIGRATVVQLTGPK